MFGRKKEGKPKQRWFFKVENLDDAHAAMKIAYQVFYTLAALQGVILGALMAFSDLHPSNLGDPILMVFLASLIHLRQSRTAATILLIYSIFIGSVTLMSRLGIPHFFFGGKKRHLGSFSNLWGVLWNSGHFQISCAIENCSHLEKRLYPNGRHNGLLVSLFSSRNSLGFWDRGRRSFIR